MNDSPHPLLEGLQRGEGPETIVDRGMAEVDGWIAQGKGLEALTAISRIEAALGDGFGGLRGSGLGVRHVERARVHALLRFRERADAGMTAIRRAVEVPGQLASALALEVERAIRLSRAFVELGWFTHAQTLLENAELPLGYLGPAPQQRYAWLRQRASWAFASRELDEARASVREYHALFPQAGLPDGELEALLDELPAWLEVAPVRTLVADLATRCQGRPELEGRLLAWDLASTLFFPWDEALEADLEARLREPTVPMLEALVERVGESLAARSATIPSESPSPGAVEDAGRVLALLDRLAELALGRGEGGLALRARTIAHEQMLDVLASVRPETMAAQHPVDAARIRQFLARAPWSNEARGERLRRLRDAAGPTASGPVLAVMVADPEMPPAEAVALAGPTLAGPVSEDALDLAAALVGRTGLRGAEQLEDERPAMSLATGWLEEATRSNVPAFAAEAEEIFAEALEVSGDLPGALERLERVAAYFEARDHDRWVRAIERCAMLAKQTGQIAAAGRAARSGFRPGGKVRPPSPDMPEPKDPLDAEEQAERAIAVALRTHDPEVGEEWLTRALSLYEHVPDGRRREDEIWERIADLWQDEADALFEAGDASSEALDDAHRRAHEALVRAIEVNEELGDGERVFELSGRVLDVLWTWLTRWEDALDAFLSLARGRFHSALERGDLEHAAAARVELMAHLADFREDADALEGADGDSRELMMRFELLEHEMAAGLDAETRRLGEPWWVERLARRAALIDRRFTDGDA